MMFPHQDLQGASTLRKAEIIDESGVVVTIRLYNSDGSPGGTLSMGKGDSAKIFGPAVDLIGGEINGESWEEMAKLASSVFVGAAYGLGGSGSKINMRFMILLIAACGGAKADAIKSMANAGYEDKVKLLGEWMAALDERVALVVGGADALIAAARAARDALPVTEQSIAAALWRAPKSRMGWRRRGGTYRFRRRRHKLSKFAAPRRRAAAAVGPSTRRRRCAPAARTRRCHR